MEIEKRSQIAAKKRNNRTRRELPLLAAQDAIPADMLTTPDAQRERLERIANYLVGYRAGLDAFDQDCAARAATLREFCRLHLDADGFAALEARTQCIRNYDAVYQVDFWSREAARLEPSLCPHAKNDHEVCRALGHDRCPVCLSAVELADRADDKSSQLSWL